MAHYINIHFRADLSELVRNRPFVMCFVDHPEARGIFFTINDTDRWLFTVPYAPEREKAPADFTPAHCKDLVRKAVGLPHMPVDILSAHPWEAASLVADRFQIGQIFLAGDAAHVMPPFGAFGINTGVQDAHNLAWKLAMVLKGQAGSSLLSTYDAERRPVGQFTTKHSEDRLEGMLSRTVSDLLQEGGLSHIQQQLIAMLGYQYVSDAVIPEHDEAAPTDRLALSGQPGTRAPHLWVQHGSRRISMLDLFDRHFVLLTGENGQPWREAMHTLARHLGLDLDAYCVGTASDLIDLDRKWSPSYGVGRDGAVLVRPDGFVAWRIKEPNCTPYSTLARVLGQLLCRFPG
jgi:putative polyketide hydroxylase